MPSSQLGGKLSRPEVASPEPLPAARRGAVWDLVGVAALLGGTGWTAWAGVRSGGDPAAFATLTGVCAGAILLGRILSTRRPWITPALVVVASLIVAALSGATLLSSAPLAGPFGYANAKAAFFVQAAAAALLLAVTTGGGIPRAIGAVAFLSLGMVVPASGSLTASGVLLLPLVGLAGGLGPRVARLLTAVFAVLFLLSLAATIVLAARFSRGGEEEPIDRFVESALDRRRVALWNDAFVLMTEHPLTGVGPERFEELRTTAPDDPDARWAHQEFLQHGAETGVPGLVFFALVFVAGFGRLWDRADTLAAVAAGSLAAVGIHACLDYVLHFPSVPLAAAALLGAATGRRGVAS